MLWIFALVVLVWIDLAQRLDRMEFITGTQWRQAMSLEQEVLDAITSLTSSVDSVILWIQNQPTEVIDAAGKDRIIAALNADKVKLDAAIPPPPTP